MQIFNLFHLYGPICCITLHLINQGLVRLVKTGINFQATCHPEIKKKKNPGLSASISCYLKSVFNETQNTAKELKRICSNSSDSRERMPRGKDSK